MLRSYFEKKSLERLKKQIIKRVDEDILSILSDLEKYKSPEDKMLSIDQLVSLHKYRKDLTK